MNHSPSRCCRCHPHRRSAPSRRRYRSRSARHGACSTSRAMPPSSRARGGNGLVGRGLAWLPDARFHGKGDPSRLRPPPNVGATLGTRLERRPRPTPICDLGSRPPRTPQLPLTSRLSTGPLAVPAPPTRRPFGSSQELPRVSGGAFRGTWDIDRRTRGGLPMSGVDKMKNKAQELSGEGKESLGEATDNRDLQAEGTKDQMAGNLKQAGEKVKDAFK